MAKTDKGQYRPPKPDKYRPPKPDKYRPPKTDKGLDTRVEIKTDKGQMGGGGGGGNITVPVGPPKIDQPRGGRHKGGKGRGDDWRRAQEAAAAQQAKQSRAAPGVVQWGEYPISPFTGRTVQPNMAAPPQFGPLVGMAYNAPMIGPYDVGSIYRTYPVSPALGQGAGLPMRADQQGRPIRYEDMLFTGHDYGAPPMANQGGMVEANQQRARTAGNTYSFRPVPPFAEQQAPAGGGYGAGGAGTVPGGPAVAPLFDGGGDTGGGYGYGGGGGYGAYPYANTGYLPPDQPVKPTDIITNELPPMPQQEAVALGLMTQQMASARPGEVFELPSSVQRALAAMGPALRAHFEQILAALGFLPLGDIGGMGFNTDWRTPLGFEMTDDLIALMRDNMTADERLIMEAMVSGVLGDNAPGDLLTQYVEGVKAATGEKTVTLADGTEVIVPEVPSQPPTTG